MSTTVKKKNRKKKAAPYGDPTKKIEAGLPWVYSLKVDPDNAKSILDEQKKSRRGEYDPGPDFVVIINERIRKGYKSK